MIPQTPISSPPFWHLQPLATSTVGSQGGKFPITVSEAFQGGRPGDGQRSRGNGFPPVVSGTFPTKIQEAWDVNDTDIICYMYIYMHVYIYVFYATTKVYRLQISTVCLH